MNPKYQLKTQGKKNEDNRIFHINILWFILKRLNVKNIHFKGP